MEVKKSVIAAIASAVNLYLTSEQEALMAMQQMARAERPQTLTGLWAIAGRKQAMDIRWTWQMRICR
ncbi:MAG TPA: hypothetical protein PLM79_10105 [Syntrophobacteraceae bacterium]|nr:hypothetical protein [Syntrophobacteraceae bacterium]